MTLRRRGAAAALIAAITLPAAAAASTDALSLLDQAQALRDRQQVSAQRAAAVGELFPEVADHLAGFVAEAFAQERAELDEQFAATSIQLAQAAAAGDPDAEAAATAWFELEGDPAISGRNAADPLDTPLELPSGPGAPRAAASGPLVCPVQGPVTFINDWGFPRSGGRTHQGNDLFAAVGTPLVATEAGTVLRVNRVDTYSGGGRGSLGGKTVTFQTPAGISWYYAHLDQVAPHIEVGTTLAAGEQLGTVGNTGNARTTPPHLHIGRYLPDGPASNPYPLLRASC